MNCDEAVNLICRRIDGELDAAQANALATHLADCSACRATAEALALGDADLRRAFAPERRRAAELAENTIARRHAEQAGAHRLRIGALLRPLFAAAAGFALAVMLWQPWRRPAQLPIAIGPTTVPVIVPAIAPQQPVGRLSLATGQVDVLESPSDQWHALVTGGGVPAGAQLRTPPGSCCEVTLSDGSAVRLNSGTVAAINSSRDVELISGQLFSTVQPADRAFAVRDRSNGLSLTALGTAFDLLANPRRAVLTVVAGTVRIDGPDGNRTVRTGESLSVADGRFGDPVPIQNMVAATRWIDELLVLKGHDNPELAARVNDLLAQLGDNKMSYLASEDIRRLGDQCVVPLARYIQSDRSRGRDDRRREAARVIADVASTRQIAELINLLGDADSTVRFHAATALARLTDRNMGMPPASWRDAGPPQRSTALRQWHDWWGRNSARFPGAGTTPLNPL
ncbi:MAG: FecR domain-containing protein [Tepidisphaerales bacterium]